MAEAHYTIDVRFIGTYHHAHCGVVLAFAFGHEPNIIRLAFG
jgi:hypothetical protein